MRSVCSCFTIIRLRCASIRAPFVQLFIQIERKRTKVGQSRVHSVNLAKQQQNTDCDAPVLDKIAFFNGVGKNPEHFVWTTNKINNFSLPTRTQTAHCAASHCVFDTLPHENVGNLKFGSNFRPRLSLTVMWAPFKTNRRSYLIIFHNLRNGHLRSDTSFCVYEVVFHFFFFTQPYIHTKFPKTYIHQCVCVATATKRRETQRKTHIHNTMEWREILNMALVCVCYRQNVFFLVRFVCVCALVFGLNTHTILVNSSFFRRFLRLFWHYSEFTDTIQTIVILFTEHSPIVLRSKHNCFVSFAMINTLTNGEQWRERD